MIQKKVNELKYQELTARRYGIVINQNNNYTMFDPVDFLLADAFIQTPTELKENISNFLTKTVESNLIDLEKKIKLETNENNDSKKEKKHLLDLTVDELYQVIKKGLTKKENNKLFWGSPKRIIKKNKLKNDKIKFDSHAGGILLSGTVASKSKGWHEVDILGPYVNSKNLLQRINCDCKDAKFGRNKSGYENFNLVCFNTATLLTYANKFPEEIPNFDKYKSTVGKNGIFLPFKYEPNQVIETLIGHYVQNISKSKLSKTLLNEVEFQHKVKNLLDVKKASFRVIPNKIYSNVYDGATKKLINKIKYKLEQVGYKMDASCVYEKFGTEYEAVTINFLKQNNDGTKNNARIYIKDGPPLIIYRKSIDDESNINSTGRTDIASPWHEIFHDKTQNDHTNSINTNYKVRLPIFKNDFLPKKLHKDYINKLKQSFGNDLKEFKRRIMNNYSEGFISKAYKNEVFKFINY
jgi:hypothetical protein